MTESTNHPSVWDQLLAAKLATGEAPKPDADASPWFVNVLLAFCGWLAAVFLLMLLFLVFNFLLKVPISQVLVGSVAIFVAFMLLNKASLFKQNLGLAISLAGQVLLVLGLTDILPENALVIGLVIFGVEVVLCFLISNYLHRVISAFAACVALYFALRGFAFVTGLFGALLFVSAYLWLNEVRFLRRIDWIHPIAYGVVLSLVVLSSTRVFDSIAITGLSGRGFDLSSLAARSLTQAAIAVAVLYVVFKLLGRAGHAPVGKVSVLSVLGVLLLCIASLFAPGVSIGATILLIGFAISDRILMVLGVVSLLFYIACYYYQLDTTLITKSLTLLAVGVLLLAGRVLINYALPQDKRYA